MGIARPSAFASAAWVPESSPPQPDANRQEALLLETLAAVARLPVADGSPHPMLSAFAELAVRGIGPALGASVVLGSPGEPTLLVSTDRIAQALDGAQHRAAQGPVWDAYGSGTPASTAELPADARWPVLGPLLPTGTHAVVAVPLAIGAGRPGGVLTLFGTPELAGPGSIRRAEAFAAAASTLLREHAAVGDLRRQLGQLQDALDARALIEQAKGILMGRYGMDAESAFGELSRRSQTTNVKVREVARRLVSGAGRATVPDIPAEEDILPIGTGGTRPTDPRPPVPTPRSTRPRT